MNEATRILMSTVSNLQETLDYYKHEAIQRRLTVELSNLNNSYNLTREKINNLKQVIGYLQG